MSDVDNFGDNVLFNDNTKKTIEGSDSDPSSDASEFQLFGDEEEDSYVITKPKKKTVVVSQVKNPEHEVRRKFAKELNKKKRMNNYSDDEFVNSSRSYSNFATVSQKKEVIRRSRSQPKVVADDIEYSEENSDGQKVHYKDRRNRPKIQFIIGYKGDGESKEFMCKFHDSPLCKFNYISSDEVDLHPGGVSSLQYFTDLEKEHGVVDSDDIVGLKILKCNYKFTDYIDDIPERIITYDQSSDMYLIKFKNHGYEYSFWKKRIDDENLIKSWNYRTSLQYAYTVDVLNKAWKPFGEGPDCSPVPEYKNGHTLRSYQLEALNWMRGQYHRKRNSILADEMGLGKTVMCISLLQYISADCGVSGPFLIVTPLSTFDNWVREFREWTDMDTIIFHGSPKDREVINQYEFFHMVNGKEKLKIQVVITNKETVISEPEVLRKIGWHYVIVDEAHMLKNKSSLVYSQMFSLRMDHILLMTGTPIQNKLDELYSLIYFIDPKRFPSEAEFMKNYPIGTAEDISKLQQLLNGYMLRRRKNDVDSTIASKEETIVEVELTKVQKFYYRTLIDKQVRNRKYKSKALSSDLNSLAMQLRKVCNHPFLFEEVREEVIKPDDNPNEVLISASGKTVFVDKLLAKLYSQGSKVLIFSQFKKVLDILEELLAYREYKSVRLDGELSHDERCKVINQFNDKDEGIFVFLLSTKAGGVGLNLTAANTVIIYDSDWNPQNDIQAQARCHRIGQTQEVKIYKLITRNTYEQEMFNRTSLKLGLDHAILDLNVNSNISNKEIETLIRKGAYSVFNEDDSAAEQFISADIDSILENCAHSVQKNLFEGKSAFSKACFVVEEGGEPIDINDKDFWEKVVPEPLKRELAKYDEKEILQKRTPKKIFTDSTAKYEQSEGIWKKYNRDLLLSSLLLYGVDRWDDISAYCGNFKDIDELRNASIYICSLVAKNLEDPTDFLSIVFETNKLELTKQQKQFQKLSIFNNDSFLEEVSQNARKFSQHLISMKLIKDWKEDKLVHPKIDSENPSSNWKKSDDENLLQTTYTHGYKNYDEIANDPRWKRFSSFSISQVKKRFKVIINALFKAAKSKKNGKKPKSQKTKSSTDNVVVWSFNDVKQQHFKSLLKYLQFIGIPTKLYFSYYQDIMPNADIKTIVPKILECIKIIEFYYNIAESSAMKKTLNSILPGIDRLLMHINSETASIICDNCRFISRLKLHLDSVGLPNVEEIASLTLNTFVPSFWEQGECDVQLIDYVSQYQFSDLYSFILESCSNIDKNLREKIEDHQTFYLRRAYHKNSKGDFEFFSNELIVIDRIDEIIESLGGYKVPRVLFVPDVLPSELNVLPLSDSYTTIESLGEGPLYVQDGYLYRVGMSSRMKLNKLWYTFEIESSDNFVIKNNKNQVWKGTTASEAFGSLELTVYKKPIEYFGVSNIIVQYIFDSEYSGKDDNGYVSPIFEKFTSVVSKRN